MIGLAPSDLPLDDAFIAVSGNIGAGKSTLVERLSTLLGSPGILEDHLRNPYLKPFYREPNRWAFHVQAGFLSLSIQDHQAVARGGGRAVLERTLDEHHAVFAAQLREEDVLSAEEFEILDRLHLYASTQSAAVPTMVIYLKAPAEELLRRVRSRGRNAESDVGLDYLTALNQRYDRFAEQWSASPLVNIDTMAIDIREDAGIAAVASRCAEATAKV
ncbi:MAG: deoxynucleoside kinase [Solirubrobacterales bacterium]